MSTKPSLEAGKAAMKAKRCVVCGVPTSGLYANCKSARCAHLWVWGVPSLARGQLELFGSVATDVVSGRG